MNSTVWAVQANMRRNGDGSWSPRFDLSCAAQFGSLEFVFGHGQVALLGSAAGQSAAERLRDFDPENDYVLPVGDTVLVGIVFAELARAGHRIRALRWDQNSRRYDVVTV